MGKRARIDQLPDLTFWAGIFFAILPFIILARSVIPSGDDFCFAGRTRRMGWSAVNAWYYHTWTGRFASTAVLTTLPVDRTTYSFYPLITIAALALSLYWFVRECIGRYAPKRECAMISAVLGIAYINMMPHLSEGLYWLPSVVTYQWANILMLVVLSLMLRAIHTERVATRVLCTALAAVTAFAAGAMNESSMVMLPFVLVVCIVFTSRTRDRLLWVAPLLCAAIAGVIVFKSPGNSVRLATAPNTANLRWTIELSGIEAVMFSTRWLANGPLLLGSALCVPIAMRVVRSMRAAGVRVPRAWMAAVATLGAVAAGFAPPSWGLGMQPPGRTINAMCFVFVIGWAVFLFALIDAGTDRDLPAQFEGQLGSRLRLVLTVLFGLSLLSNSILTAYGDIGRTAGPYRLENAMRDRELATARANGVKDLVLTPFTIWPGTIATEYWDFQPDPNQWMNLCYAEYAGYRTVRVKPLPKAGS